MSDDDTKDAQITALVLVVNNIRRHLGMRPQDFSEALQKRLAAGSDGTPWQDSYCGTLEALMMDPDSE